MPIRLIEPRKGKSPYFTGRGTHLGVYVERSTKARKRSLARRIIAQWESEIERGVFVQPGDPTFASAALAYMKAGGERRFLAPLLHHFQNTPLQAIDQAAIDAAAEAILPLGTAATRNRQVYTPASAVLRRAGIVLELRRPIGHDKAPATEWLWPEQAWRLFAAAGALDAEFRLFLIMLVATGLRLSELLRLTTDATRLAEAFAYVPDTKTGTPQPVHLPPALVAELANHPRGLDRPGETVFRFHKGGHIYALLRVAAIKAEVELPPRRAFHILRHSYATWMRRFAGADLQALLGTNWKSIKSVQRYTHVVTSEEARRADALPILPPRKPARARRGKSVDSRARRAKA